MRSSLGYPGIRTATKDSSEATAHDVRPEDRPYLCVAYDVEQSSIQPMRAAAALVGGPLVIYASRQLPEDREVLRTATLLMGCAVTAWSAWVWNKANTEMIKGPS
jgi:hypothetical protein